MILYLKTLNSLNEYKKLSEVIGGEKNQKPNYFYYVFFYQIFSLLCATPSLFLLNGEFFNY